MSLAMVQVFKTWLTRLRCTHHYRYSRSRPGTLVRKHCRKRKPKP